MYKTIKYPYKLLTELELERLNEYKERHNFNDEEIGQIMRAAIQYELSGEKPELEDSLAYDPVHIGFHNFAYGIAAEPSLAYE